MTIEITVLMPMRNAAPYVHEAVCSVLACRSVSLELLVIDDGSTDNSRAIVEQVGDSRIRVIPGPCQGIAAAMNLGLSEARGAILMRCDADDLFTPNRIARQVEWMREHKDAIAVCGAFEMIDGNGVLVASPFEHLGVPETNITSNLLAGIVDTHLCTFAMRRQFAIQAGFRSFFETAEDLDFACRLAERGNIIMLSDLFYSYRLHGDSITHTQKTPRRVFYETAARQFAQQRVERGFDDLMIGAQPVPPDETGGKATSAAEHISKLATGHAWRLYRDGEKWAAICASIKALRSSPLRSENWLTTAKLIALSTINIAGLR